MTTLNTEMTATEQDQDEEMDLFLCEEADLAYVEELSKDEWVGQVAAPSSNQTQA